MSQYGQQRLQMPKEKTNDFYCSYCSHKTLQTPERADNAISVKSSVERQRFAEKPEKSAKKKKVREKVKS